MEILDAQNYQKFDEMNKFLLLRGVYDKKNTGKRICFRTGIYESDFNNHFLYQTPFKGKGWHADFRTYQYSGNLNDIKYKKIMLDLKKRGYIWKSFTSYYDEIEKTQVIRSNPELIIYADNIRRAFSAIRLIPVALSVFQNSFFDVEQKTTKYFGWELDERLVYFLHEIPENRYSQPCLAQSIKLLAKASQSNKIKYSMLRYWASKKLCTVDELVNQIVDYGSAGFYNHPIAHTLFSQSIVLAYGAIEELGLGMEFKTKKDFKEIDIHNSAYKKLKIKLEKLNINPEKEILWSTFKKTRKIDRKFKVESLRVVNDLRSRSTIKNIKLIDAIYFVSRLRSNLSAHKFKADTLTLTEKDVWNTQNIAKYLIGHQTQLLDEMPVKTF